MVVLASGFLNRHMSDSSLPILEGIRILDLSTIVAGPTASMILADLGADVIKVGPIGGEDGRAMGPHRGLLHWVALFDQNDIANDAVQNTEQVLADSQAKALDQFASVYLGDEASALVPRLPLEFSARPAASLGPPPRLGEHGRAILKEAGYGEHDIDDLDRSGACAFR
jgi:crotonobetainyl-CoA:carnitine CoA-transferase CaiB-like acyl-CoA transferase